MSGVLLAARRSVARVYMEDGVVGPQGFGLWRCGTLEAPETGNGFTSFSTERGGLCNETSCLPL